MSKMLSDMLRSPVWQSTAADICAANRREMEFLTVVLRRDGGVLRTPHHLSDDTTSSSFGNVDMGGIHSITTA